MEAKAGDCCCSGVAGSWSDLRFVLRNLDGATEVSHY